MPDAIISIFVFESEARCAEQHVVAIWRTGRVRIVIRPMGQPCRRRAVRIDCENLEHIVLEPAEDDAARRQPTREVVVAGRQRTDRSVGQVDDPQSRGPSRRRTVRRRCPFSIIPESIDDLRAVG